MSRGLWFVAGAGAGVYGMVRGRRAAEAFSGAGFRDRVEALRLGARLFRDEVAQGATERETELRERYGLPPHGRPQLEARSTLEADPLPEPDETMETRP
jgi:hypothetical protein